MLPTTSSPSHFFCSGFKGVLNLLGQLFRPVNLLAHEAFRIIARQESPILVFCHIGTAHVPYSPIHHKDVASLSFERDKELRFIVEDLLTRDPLGEDYVNA